jgi:serine/threonine protein kinase
VAGDPNVAGDDRIGNYRVVRTLLQGQGSIVLEVTQEGSGKRFALKELIRSKAKDPAERKIFEAEAKLGMVLRHPNLVQVYEYVKDKNAPYFVMDYFPSQTMRLVLAKTALYDEYRSKLHRIMTQTASGLAYMHDKGWIHRDVKPENVIVNKTGEVRLIDYSLSLRAPTGLAKLLGGKPARQGTHTYMSPEQIRCETPSPAADIYSLGIMFYEFAVRKPPFRADSPVALLRKHIQDAPTPLQAVDKNVTPEFADLVMRMIKKKAADRPKSVHEVFSQLSRARIFKDDPMPQALGGM